MIPGQFRMGEDLIAAIEDEGARAVADLLALQETRQLENGNHRGDDAGEVLPLADRRVYHQARLIERLQIDDVAPAIEVSALGIGQQPARAGFRADVEFEAPWLGFTFRDTDGEDRPLRAYQRKTVRLRHHGHGAGQGAQHRVAVVGIELSAFDHSGDGSGLILCGGDVLVDPVLDGADGEVGELAHQTDGVGAGGHQADRHHRPGDQRHQGRKP